MSRVSKKDFADKVGQTTKWLAVYITRGKVVVGEDGKIDDKNPVNASFLKQHAQQDDQVPRSETWVEPNSTGEQPEHDLGDIPPVYISDARYKHHLAVKTERAAELDRLKIEKIRGEVIPSDLVKPVFLQHNQSILTEFKNTVEQLITDFTQIKELTTEEIARMRAAMIEALNSGVTNATKATIKGIDNIINDYSDKRGVGERA